MQQEELSRRPTGPLSIAGLIKIMSVLIVLVGSGWLVTRQLFEARSAPVEKNESDATPMKVRQFKARLEELRQLYTEINFGQLSDYFYYSPDPREPLDPALVEKSTIPPDIKALNGRKVSIMGFMMPLDYDSDGSTEFVVNGNYDMCGFGRPAQINEWIMVKFTGRGKVPNTHLPSIFFGTLEVGEEYRDGRVYSLYRMKADAAATPRGLIE